MDLNKMPKAERAAPMNVWNRRAVPLSAPVGVEGLMQLAREWCLSWGEWAHDADPGCAKESAAEAALRAALTQALAQAPASGEAVAPFGYCADFETGLYECSHKFYYLAPGQPVPEGCTPFYTTPPAPVPAVRVTDELVERAAREVWKVDRDHWLGGSAAFLELHPSDYARLLAIARAALEAALGQGKENG